MKGKGHMGYIMIRKYRNPIMKDFKASNEFRPHPLDTEEPLRFQSTGSCSEITQMYGEEHDEAGTRREPCEES